MGEPYSSARIVGTSSRVLGEEEKTLKGDDTMADDQIEDTQKLYKLLKEGKKSSASVIHIHLKKIHGLSEKEIRKKLTTMGLEEVVLAKIEGCKNEEP